MVISAFCALTCLYHLPSEFFLVFRRLRMFGDHCDEIEVLLVLMKPSMLSVSCGLGAGIMRVRFEKLGTRDRTSEPRLKLMPLAFSSGQAQTNFPTFVKIAVTFFSSSGQSRMHLKVPCFPTKGHGMTYHSASTNTGGRSCPIFNRCIFCFQAVFSH